ncbi:MAG: LytTR family transcriptional regulator DNA-binding domain-containing protein [Sphingobacteriales bacterium]|jgi:DNA-binding LytR/AlgR family response regulator|nr:LytTR family transcriptional regulator DNA-binding domain-containing protein [Sphingobacteriales bacterium]
MDRIKILIVEDELVVAEDIAGRLELCGYEIAGIADSSEQAVEIACRQKPDLCLVDIRIRGAVDGIDTVLLLTQKLGTGVPVIYLTAFSDAAILNKAKLTYPAAFIVKPFRDRELQIAIELALQNAERMHKRIEPDGDSKELFRLDDRFFLKIGNRFEKVYIADVAWLAAERSYCEIVTSRKRYTVASNLSQLAAKLEHPSLVRVHRSFMVNLEHIDAFEGNSVLIRQQEIPVSSNYKDDFLKRFRFL